jgi:hypothetical protein
VLCETVLNKVKIKSDVPKIVKDFMDLNTVQGGRILISSLGWTYLVEVYKKDFIVKEIDSDIAITNRFDYLSHEPEKSKVSENSSNNRLEVANQMIKDITTIGELKSMLRSHFSEKGGYLYVITAKMAEGQRAVISYKFKGMVCHHCLDPLVRMTIIWCCCFFNKATILCKGRKDSLS